MDMEFLAGAGYLQSPLINDYRAGAHVFIFLDEIIQVFINLH
jgi:hypothetical protein